jgi:hypothetical protein
MQRYPNPSPVHADTSNAGSTAVVHNLFGSMHPGRIRDDAMAMVVPISQPEGTLLPELVQPLPWSALGEPIGAVGAAALGEAASIVAVLIS